MFRFILTVASMGVAAALALAERQARGHGPVALSALVCLAAMRVVRAGARHRQLQTICPARTWPTLMPGTVRSRVS